MNLRLVFSRSTFLEDPLVFPSLVAPVGVRVLDFMGRRARSSRLSAERSQRDLRQARNEQEAEGSSSRDFLLTKFSVPQTAISIRIRP